MTEWLSLPQRLVASAARELRRIEASEALYWAQVLQVGGGVLKQSSAQDVIRGWQRAAAGPRSRRVRPKLSEAQWRARAQAAGIDVIVEPPPAQESERE